MSFWGSVDNKEEPAFLTAFALVHFVSGLLTIPIYYLLVKRIKYPEVTAIAIFFIIHLLYEIKDVWASTDNPPRWLDELDRFTSGETLHNMKKQGDTNSLVNS